jgi:hypothetical protein
MKIILLASLFVSFVCFGQLNKPVVGLAFNTSKKENFSGFLGENPIAVFTADYTYYNRKKQELFVKKFHKGDLQLIDSKNVYSILDVNYTNDPEEIFYQNGKLFVFSKMYANRDKTQLLALEVFNEHCERLSYQIIDTLKTGYIQYIEESDNKDGFIVAKHLQFTQLVEQEISLIRIDETGEIIWNKVIKSPMALQNLRIEQIRFNDKSQVYILCNYAFDYGNNMSSNQIINNKYSLWAYDHDQEFLKEFEIRIKSKWVNGVKIKINPSNDVILSGYFNETKNPTINGVFSLTINKKLEVLNSSWHKFEESTLAKFSDKQNGKDIEELEDYKLIELCIFEDGSYFLLGEQYYKFIESNYDPRTNITTTTEHYNYNSIISSYFDAQGNHQWTDRIPKAQNSTNDFGYYSSFTVLKAKQDVYLFFNDYKKNNELEVSDYYNYNGVFNNRKSEITYVQIGKMGVKNRERLDIAEDNFLLRAKLCDQIKEDAMLGVRC